jgi:predicted GNAT family N-acyltransferase
MYGSDYQKVRNLLIEIDSHAFRFGDWDWMFPVPRESSLHKIGLWEDDGRLVAATTFDGQPGNTFLMTLPGYQHLRVEMLHYAKDVLIGQDGRFKVMILDGDLAFQDLAVEQGFRPTQSKWHDAVYPIGDLSAIQYELLDGFRIVSMKDEPNAFKYGQVLWKGFNHELNGEGPYEPTDDVLAVRKAQFFRPNVNLDIKIAVVAPNGDFVSYCGMWHDPASESALVEPVATDPAYRKMGLGRAAVLEAVRRCGELGAKRAFVGSSQQFYYQIGFRPFATSTFWERKVATL